MFAALIQFGDTPLHVASKHGHVTIVQVLTMLGADVNIFNNVS